MHVAEVHDTATVSVAALRVAAVPCSARGFDSADSRLPRRHDRLPGPHKTHARDHTQAPNGATGAQEHGPMHSDRILASNLELQHVHGAVRPTHAQVVCILPAALRAGAAGSCMRDVTQHKRTPGVPRDENCCDPRVRHTGTHWLTQAMARTLGHEAWPIWSE